MNEIQFLSDRYQIEQIYIRYCELVDAKEFEKLDEVFSEDTYGFYRGASGRRSEHTRDSLITGMLASLGQTHFVGRQRTMFRTFGSELTEIAHSPK